MKGLKLAVTLVVLGTSFYSAKADAQNFQNPNQLTAQVSPLQEKPQIRDSQLKPANTSGNNSSVETQLSQGYDLLKKDDYKGAIEAFNKVLQTERNNEIATYAYFGRAIAYLSTDKYEAAKSDFDQVIALKSLKIAQETQDRQVEGNALGGLGNTYYSLGDYPKAIEYQQHFS
ncbi:tetratricopeptide repeat protein [Scytonema sp. UIC 10036]|uniref:tetratricopeptide repeat protein n=1 Tax=Scytonema sp. UIC 10036 TaxID=2304196 RepID=UPI001A9A8E6F|nr:tetratricopeptide repeat protein [Scytonema sp. UIC 10036]